MDCRPGSSAGSSKRCSTGRESKVSLRAEPASSASSPPTYARQSTRPRIISRSPADGFCGGSLAGLRRTAPQRGGCAETGCCRHANGGKYIQDSSRKSALPSIGADTPRVARGFGGRRRVRAGRRRLSRALAASGRMTPPSDASLHAVDDCFRVMGITERANRERQLATDPVVRWCSLE